MLPISKKQKRVSPLLLISLLLSCSINSPAEKEHSSFKEGVYSDAIVLQLSDEADSESILSSIKGEKKRENIINGKRFLTVSIPTERQQRALKEAEMLPHVYDATPVAKRWTFTDPPTDPLYAAQYALQLTNVPAAWNEATGVGITVAVPDTGINTLHEDFGGAGTFEAGWDLYRDEAYLTSDNWDTVGHGTHVAGIIGARRDNGRGIAGIAPDVTLIPYKLGGSSFGSDVVAAAISKAVVDNADVINLSLGGSAFSPIEAEAIAEALDNGIVVVIAIGNDSQQTYTYPASHPGVIAVGSTNGRDEVSFFSTSGYYLSVSAPGEEILSLLNINNDGYVSLSGTSMSAPYVSGVAALLLEKNSGLSPFQVRAILESTAKDINAAGFDIYTGYGRVDPVKALEAAVPLEPAGTLTVATTSAGIRVTLYTSSGQFVSSFVTGSEKKASFHGLRPGNYTYHIGTATNGTTVTITAGGTVAR